MLAATKVGWEEGVELGGLALGGGRLPRICTAVCYYNFFSKMHTIEGLKLVLCRISIENNKEISRHAQIKVVENFLKGFYSS